MVDTPTQREPLGAVAPFGSLTMRDNAHSGLLARIRTNPDPRVTRRHTSKRASGSGRTREATVPLVRKRIMSSRPAALETFRPNGRRSEGARTF
eukprot:5617677-Pleurochrysis_carterae.AAC.1